MKIAICLSLTATFAGASCGDSESVDVLETDAPCNPMGSTHCLTPFPSSLYMVDDASTATGVLLDIAEGALPTNLDGIAIDPAMFNTRDGFSAAAPIVTAFSGGVDPANLVSHTDYAASLTDDSPTILIDMERGERVAHFAELDATAADTPDQQALYLRPAARLRGATRYAVGIRKTLRARGGGELPVPEGYAAIVAGARTEHALLERMRPRYTEIFAALEAEGFAPEDFVVAWDFVTVSDASVTHDLTVSRDLALAAMGERGANLSYSIDTDQAPGDERIRRHVEGTFQSPLVLTQEGIFKPGTRLARDSDGEPMLTGMHDAPFVAIVPECAYTEGPVPIIVYGHGLFGSAGELAGGAIRDTSAAICAVVVGTDLRGMSSRDVPQAILALNNLNNGPDVFTTLIQGIVNYIAIAQIARGPMADTLFVDEQGASLVDTTRVYYYGLSQGHIFGSTFMAYDPFIERGVVGVGGANYSLMLERSRDWPLYKTSLIGAYPNPLEVVINIGLMQMMWDLTDPVTTSPGFFDAPIPNTPPKQLLMHMAIGDDEVPNLSTEYQARTMGAALLMPSVKDVWGLEQVQSGFEGSALVVYDGGDRAPLTNEPPAEDNDAHSLTRRVPATWRQMATFYETGAIQAECADNQGNVAACDCTAAMCN